MHTVFAMCEAVCMHCNYFICSFNYELVLPIQDNEYFRTCTSICKLLKVLTSYL